MKTMKPNKIELTESEADKEELNICEEQLKNRKETLEQNKKMLETLSLQKEISDKKIGMEIDKYELLKNTNVFLHKDLPVKFDTEDVCTDIYEAWEKQAHKELDYHIWYNNVILKNDQKLFDVKVKEITKQQELCEKDIETIPKRITELKKKLNIE